LEIQPGQPGFHLQGDFIGSQNSTERSCRQIISFDGFSVNLIFTNQLESGQFAVRLDTRDLNKNINQVEKSLNRSVRSLVLALLLVGMLLGSAIVSLAPIQELRFLDFIPYDVFIIVFIFAVVIALGYVLFAIWSAWRDRKR
jgi:phosphotransferase system  glucose/maltose/N-acetylglucosamine-specific IIC component